MSEVKESKKSDPVASKSTDEILAEKLEARAAKTSKADEARKLAQIEELDLEEKYEAELGGPRGQQFDIIDATVLGEGFIVVKLGAGISHKRFEAACTKAKNNVPTEADLFTFVTPSIVHPLSAPVGDVKSLDTFKGIVDRRPTILTRCAAALLDLYGSKRSDEAGKS